MISICPQNVRKTSAEGQRRPTLPNGLSAGRPGCGGIGRGKRSPITDNFYWWLTPCFGLVYGAPISIRRVSK